MRISFLVPNLSGDVASVDLGVASLATYINQRTQHHASIIDFTYHRKDWKGHLAKNIIQDNPDIIGITCVSFYMGYVRMLTQEVKNKFGLPIIAGGYHASIAPEDTLSVSSIDAVCIGDGEYALTEYLDSLQAGRGLNGILGLYYKSAGQIVKNPKRSLISDIDSLPIIDYSLWKDFEKFLYYQQLIFFVGTRGCLFSCTYCGVDAYRQAVPGKHYRLRNPRQYANEIKYQWEKYKHKGMRMAHCFDALFTADLNWLKDFCDEYIKIGLANKLPYSVFASINTIDDEKIRLLAQSNCRIVRFGIEAGNEQIRRQIYKKDIPTERIKYIIKACRQAGIITNGHFIIGGPGETRRTLEETYQLARELDLDRPIFFNYRPLPKTEGADKLLELGGQISPQPKQAIDSFHWGTDVSTKELSSREIVYFRQKMLAIFYIPRLLKLIRKQKFKFFVDMSRYIIKGLIDGVDLRYLIGYALLYCGDNATS